MFKTYKKDAIVKAIQFNSKEHKTTEKYKDLPIYSLGQDFKLTTLEGAHVLRESFMKAMTLVIGMK